MPNNNRVRVTEGDVADMLVELGQLLRGEGLNGFAEETLALAELERKQT